MNSADHSNTPLQDEVLVFEATARELTENGQLDWSEPETVVNQLDLIAQLYERKIHEIINEILHHPRFQRMEAVFRSLEWMTDVAHFSDRVRISVLDVSAAEIESDLDAGYRRSMLYRKIYVERFDTPFGKASLGDPKAVGYPFGLIVGDYEFSHDKSKHSYSEQQGSRENAIDLGVLQQMANLARDSFCPFVCGVSPDVFGIESFKDLENVQDLGDVFESSARTAWRMFRRSDVAKFVGLVLPRVLIRRPYTELNEDFVYQQVEGRRTFVDHSFVFNENVEGEHENLLWANGSYAFGHLVCRAFEKCGWFADIRGFETDQPHEGGVIDTFFKYSSRTDAPGVAPICPTETVITVHEDSLFSDLGFIPLCSHQHTDFCGVLSCQSPLERAANKDDHDFNLSTMFNYVLCVCRLGLELKYEQSKLIGQSIERNEIERILEQSIRVDVTTSTDPRIRRNKPLAKATVNVVKDLDNPGAYICHFQFSPHFQFDNVRAEMSLKTVLKKGQ